MHIAGFTRTETDGKSEEGIPSGNNEGVIPFQ